MNLTNRLRTLLKQPGRSRRSRSLRRRVAAAQGQSGRTRMWRESHFEPLEERALLAAALIGVDFGGDSNITFPTDVTAQFSLAGMAQGEYDQVRVLGASRMVTLGSAELLVDFVSFTPQAGDSFTLVDLVESTSQTIGTFSFRGSALAQDAILVVNDSSLQILAFQIDYQGGDGNDVVLTRLNSGGFDFGDAPDTGIGTGPGNYQTTLLDNGPVHRDTAGLGLRLGVTVDTDNGSLRNAQANADDTDGALPDDEDGVLNPLGLQGTIGAQPTVTLLVTNTTGNVATLSGWIDYNSDGVFDNATERATASVSTGSNDVRVTLTFPTIPNGSAGTTYSRFRLSTDAAFVASPGSTAAASDGEVEDYVFSITAPSNGTVDRFLKIADGRGGLASDTLAIGASFGVSVTNLGDLDGDGVADLAVGAYRDSTDGAVHVLFLNGDGTVKGSTKITDGSGGLASGTLVNGDRFGTSVANLGDLDGDGVSDLAVGAYRDDTGGTNSGAVHVLFLNGDGTVKRSTKIADGTGGLASGRIMNFGHFGNSVTNMGDVDGDGVTDLAVGSFRDDTGGTNRGAVYVLFLNGDGTVKGSTKIADRSGGLASGTLSDGDYFGTSVANLGDLDGDGVSDLAVGAYRDDTGGTKRGAVHVLFLNRDGSVKGSTKIADGSGGLELMDGDNFGSSVTNIGDVDGDGVADLAVGAFGDDTGGGRTFSNRGAVYVLFLNGDGTVKGSTKIADGSGRLASGTLADFDSFGTSVANLGDLDGDGVVELAVGANRDGTNGNPYFNRGAVYILSLAPPPQTITVDIAIDEDDGNTEAGDLSLREAIGLANATSSVDTITFAAALDGSSLELTTVGDRSAGPSAFLITSEITIAGSAGGITLSGATAVEEMRLFNVASGGNLTLRQLTLSGGIAHGGNGADGAASGGGGAAGLGGAIFNQGTLTIERSTLTGNLAQGGNGGRRNVGANINYGGGGGLDEDGQGDGSGGGPNGGSSDGFGGGNGGFGGGGGGGGDGGFGGFGGGGGAFTGGGFDGSGDVFDSSGGGLGGFGGGGSGGDFLAGLGGFGGGDGSGGRFLGDGVGDGGGGGGGLGGAVFNNGGRVVLVSSTLSGNTAQAGIGGGNADDGDGFGGAVFNRSGILTILDSTLANNTVSGLSTGGGAVFNLGDLAGTSVSFTATLVVNNSILADTNGGNDFEGATTSGLGTFRGTSTITGSDNLVESSENVSATVIAVTDDPRLGPLADNSGPTFTHTLLSGSPAIDAGAASSSTSDQRGGDRTIDLPGIDNASDATDIGAFELADVSLDFGDAPSEYPVTLAQDGARHTVGELFLGSLIDVESDGQPTAAADGDDNSGDADDDGVFVIASLVATGASSTVSSFAVTASAAGKLDAWIDFDQSGSWEAGEQIFNSVDVAAGLNVLSFTIPAAATPGDTGARYRISSAGGLAPTGAAADGEVEDYIATIVDGDVAGDAAAEIDPPLSGTLDVFAEGNDVVVRSSATVLFRAPGSTINRLEFFGLGGDDTFNLANLDAIFSGLVGAAAEGGNDTLRLTGENQDLDVTTIPNGTFSGIEVIDIRGSGINSLKLSEADVAGLPDAGATLKVIIDAGDTVDLIDGVLAINNSLIENGEFFVVAQSDSGTTIHLGGLTWSNPLLRLDVDNSGGTTALDALLIVKQLSRRQFVLPDSDTLIDPQNLAIPFPLRFFDTTADGKLTALDALRVINGLARISSGGDPEGETLIAPMIGSKFSKTDVDDEDRVLLIDPVDRKTKVYFSIVSTNVREHVSSDIDKVEGTTEIDQDANGRVHDETLNLAMAELFLQ